MLSELARQLCGIKGLIVQRFYDCRAFCRAYPTILQRVSGGWQRTGLLSAESLPTPLASAQSVEADASTGIASNMLLTRLSFSPFLELLALDRPLQRAFYEVQVVKNSWSVHELKRSINSALYERTGLSTDKAAVLAGHAGAQPPVVADVVKKLLRARISKIGRAC